MLMMNYNLQRGKLQLCGARTTSSKYYSSRGIFSSGTVEAPFCVKSKEQYQRPQSPACPTFRLSEGCAIPPEQPLYSLPMYFCLGGCLCLEPTALTSFRTWLKPHRGQGASRLQPLSRLIIPLYLSFPVVIYTYHDYW